MRAHDERIYHGHGNHAYVVGCDINRVDCISDCACTVKLQPGDPAYFLKFTEHKSVPVIFKIGCYICEDSEFAQMGLPLCQICCQCGGHVAADNGSCDDCEWECNPDCYEKHGTIEHLPLFLCTCERPCCEVDVLGPGYPLITCGGQHCPEHGESYGGR